MIWFTCKKCDKTHGRPESSIGATIFCDCGQGLVVPWESTAAQPAEPPPLPEPVAAAHLPPPVKLEPVTFDAEPSRPGPPPLRPRRRARMSRRDPQLCFNHEDIAKQTTCTDCGESFCGECLVTFEDDVLCAPCKNYRVKNLQRAVSPSRLAVLSILIAFLTAPATFCFLPVGQIGFPWWSLVALLPQGLAAGLSIMALREAETDPQDTGRSLAITGLVSAGVTGVVIILLTMYTPQNWT